MNGPRLIKRTELLEREQSCQLPVRPASTSSLTNKTAKAWVKSRQETRQPSPRAAFAALFALLIVPAAEMAENC